METNRSLAGLALKTALAVPAFAALTALSYAVHTSITAAVLLYSSLWQRQRANLLRRELGPGIYYTN
jgi:hypothetical protein